MATIVWDTRVRTGSESLGLELNRRIWADMKSFPGYLSHRLLQDEDDAGHFVIVSEWRDRAAADRARELYVDVEPLRRLTPILAGPRQRFVLDDRTQDEP